ncbi:MAG: HNH endonuclease signature motif containing protein [Phycisphaerales bacterium]
MGANCNLSPNIVDRTRRNPTNGVLLELGRAARDAHVLKTTEFKKLIAYLLEYADGRDRREPLTVVPGQARPVPRLRVAVDRCFGTYADLHWFKINKAVNASSLPLTGLFPHVAASLGRVRPEDFGYVVGALVHRDPDAALLRLLNRRGGRVKGLGLQLFSRLAVAFRRDLYFVIPHEWGTASGALRFVGNDLRKYCAFCRALRTVCDDVGITAKTRGPIFDLLMRADPANPRLLEALNGNVGPTIGRATELKATDGYLPPSDLDGRLTMPLEFTAPAILARRGQRPLRYALLKAYGNHCAITGACPKDLLEVAYIAPFPKGDVNSVENAMLLRSDIHTLWDLNLIGVDPQDLSIHVAKRLRGSTYENLCGRTIVQRRNGSQLNQEVLRERWEIFVQSRGPKKAAVTIEPTPTVSARSRKPSLDAPMLVRSNGEASGAATPDVVTVPIA